MPVIGFLNSGSRAGFAHFLAAFHQSLKETGDVEGRDVTTEYRWPEGRYDRLPPISRSAFVATFPFTKRSARSENVLKPRRAVQ